MSVNLEIIIKIISKNDLYLARLKGLPQINDLPFLFHILIVDLMPGSGVINKFLENGCYMSGLHVDY